MINIIMPTYNDEKTIIESIKSVVEQNYENWKLYVVNDGSTDNTENVLKNYIEENNLTKKISYIKQENQDQLRAINNALSYINDENSIIYILHSDDVLNDANVLLNAYNYFKNNECDAIISDFDIINENSEVIGIHKVNQYKKNNNTLALQTLWLGRNLFTDMAFWKYSFFINSVKNNYLEWNTPFWIDFTNKVKMANVQKVNFKFFKYRVFDENYINNEVGMLNVLNGELRTEIQLLKYYDIYFFKLQYYLFRIYNKLKLSYKVFYLQKETINKYMIIKFLINKRINNKNIKKYEYYYSVLNFYKFCNNNNNTLMIDEIDKKDIFTGADIRKFNKLMLEHKLPNIYYKIFDQMNRGGFNSVLINKKNYDLVVNLLKFLNIFDSVKIEFYEEGDINEK